MKIKHLKFDSIASTHKYLKEKIYDFDNTKILVSTKSQPEGIGRSSNNWVHFKDSLAFSFVITPLKNLILTPLEVVVQVVNFLQPSDQSIRLKWPNDLVQIDKQEIKKVGGILCQYIDQETIIVSIGLNLNIDDQTKNHIFKFPPGAISYSYKKEEDFFHSIPASFYQHILKNRLSDPQVINSWKNLCFHQDKRVVIKDDNMETEGIFLGIGSQGEALIETNKGVEKIISGSLFLLD